MIEGWKKVQVLEICTKGSSNIAQNKIEDNFGEYPLYGASGFLKKIDFYHQEKPYIGIVKDGSGVGRVGFYPAKSSLLGTLQYILPKEGYDIRFVGYALKSLDLASFSTGAAIPHIYFKDYGKSFICVPPTLEEQERVVNELDLLTGIIDKKNAQLRDLDALSQAIFYEMFGNNMSFWPSYKLGDICDTTSGGTPSKSHPEYYLNGTIPWLRSGEVEGTNITDTGIKITDLGVKYSSAKWFPAQTVVVAMYGATVGEVGILGKPMTTNQAVCGILPNDSLRPLYLYSWFRSKKRDFVEQATGGAQPNISQNIIRNAKICCPPLDVQDSYVERLASIEEQKMIIDCSLKQIQYLLDSRMDHYFNE